MAKKKKESKKATLSDMFVLDENGKVIRPSIGKYFVNYRNHNL